MTIHPAFYETEKLTQNINALDTLKKGLKTLIYAGACLGLLYSSVADAVTLKTETVLEDEYLRLGDVFEGVTAHEDFVLAPAPAPGKKMILNAYALNQIAVSFGLPWKASNPFEHAEFKRSATVINASMIEDVILRKAQSDFQVKDAKVELSNSRTEFIIDRKFGHRIDITSFNYSPSQGLFDATIKLANDDEVNVSGRLIKMVEVPVLTTRLRNGDVISTQMVTWTQVPETMISSSTILDPAKIIGMTPRRSVRDGELVTDADLTAPLIVEKGEFVTMMLSNGRLNVTAKGRALDNGAKGDIIRIMNKSSNKVVEGRVTAPQTVSIDVGSPNVIF